LGLVVIAAFGLLLVLWFAGAPLWVAWRRQRLRRQPFPAAWRAIVRQRVPQVRRLPADLQLQLKRHMQVFLAEKHFVGCGGLVVTDEMRVTVAAQACLLLLNRPAGYFRGLREILIYPGAFVVDRVRADGSGVLQEQRGALAGESWAQGQVVLSWDDTLAGAAVADDGRNVVIHEFAHQLDQEKGHANGAPLLGERRRYARWSQVLGEAFAQLQRRVAREAAGAADTGAAAPAPLISAYGATDPAEFFAVVSEVFFEQPQRLAAEQPALYHEFSGYYRIDPLSW
jgi:MtfA peptidase